MAKAFNDNSGVTANSEQIELLKKHFPQCFDKNGAFKADKLKEIVGDSGTAFSKESYRLNWLGKSYARLLANENPLTFLSEDKTHNQKPEHRDSENLLIKGDNLEVLKHLKNAYREQVKMIYIDPPYNTGSDGFVYQDDRKFTPNELSRLAGIDLDEAQRILDFTQSKANSHSAWLTFMYPRLYVAREFLKEDGVIFISIDDNEVAQLRILCDEVFGEENLIGTIIWKNVTDNNPSNIATEHESIIVYAKSKNQLEGVWKSSLSEIKDMLIKIGESLVSKHKDQEILQQEYSKWFRENKFQLGALDRYKFIDSEGVYTGSQSVHNPGKEGYRYDVIHPDTHKPCKEPLMGYRFPKATMDELIESRKIIYGNDHNKIIELKVYVKDFQDKLSSIFELDGRLGANELRNIFPEHKKLFTNPKPTELLKRLISFSSGNGDLILDFFAGSGTTAHAVMSLNAHDNRNRKFIMVQIPEPCDKKSEAHKAGYQTIVEITQARIEKVAEKIKSEKPDYQGDFGFKLFETIPLPDGYLDEVEKLDSLNFDLFDGSILDDRQLDDLLTTWKVYDGIALTAPLAPIDLAGYTGWQQQKILYLVDKDFHTQALTALLQKLDDTEDKAFDIERLVLFAHNFDSKHQREISEAMTQYQNRKQKSVSVELRY